MIRSLMVGVAAVALLTGAAYAQDSTYYNRRTETVTTPFGSSQTVTTTTSHAQPPIDEDADVAVPPPPPPVAAAPPPPPAYDEQSADIGEPPPPPPPPGNYDRTMTTRQIGPDGVESDRTDSYRQHQTFYDANEELGVRTTRTRTHATSYGPAPVYAPNSVAAGPSPDIDLPPYQRRTTTTTTTTTEDGE